MQDRSGTFQTSDKADLAARKEFRARTVLDEFPQIIQGIRDTGLAQHESLGPVFHVVKQVFVPRFHGPETDFTQIP